MVLIVAIEQCTKLYKITTSLVVFADKVKEVSFDISIENNETQAIHSLSQEIIPCASSFMQVLGLFPKVKTASTTGMKLDVICNNVLERIEHSMKKETFNDLVKKICNQHELETGTYVFDITCSVEKGKMLKSQVTNKIGGF